MTDHFTNHEMMELQSLPLKHKETRSLERIEEFLKKLNGMAYVAFSGGKDSVVLRDLARRVDPEIPCVFSNTGLEYPEIVHFVKELGDVIIVKPENTFRQVVEECGYPVVSKKVSHIVARFQNPSEKNKLSRHRAINCPDMKIAYLPQKWRFLINAPFKVSDRCCDVLKKEPMKRYEKETGRAPIIGAMASEGGQREKTYKKTGCLVFEGRTRAWPMGFWTEKDVWEYIRKNEIPYSKIYDMGEDRTGCIFCAFGADQDREPNRFQRLKKTHPAQYKYCMTKLGMDSVLNFIGIPH